MGITLGIVGGSMGGHFTFCPADQVIVLNLYNLLVATAGAVILRIFHPGVGAGWSSAVRTGA
jgi:uncharacterized membrane protein YeaQ/YmgE (transglycosylase-associated protein family)